jgi:hypothetical protein
VINPIEIDIDLKPDLAIDVRQHAAEKDKDPSGCTGRGGDGGDAIPSFQNEGGRMSAAGRSWRFVTSRRALRP